MHLMNHKPKTFTISGVVITNFTAIRKCQSAFAPLHPIFMGQQISGVQQLVFRYEPLLPSETLSLRGPKSSSFKNAICHIFRAKKTVLSCGNGTQLVLYQRHSKSGSNANGSGKISPQSQYFK